MDSGDDRYSTAGPGRDCALMSGRTSALIDTEGRMKWSRDTEEQIIGILKEQEAGAPVAELCRKHSMSEATFYKRESKYGGLEVSEAKRLRALEAENAKLKRLLADAMLDNAALKDLLGKNGNARCLPRGGGSSAKPLRDERAAGVPCGRSGSVEHALPAPAIR
jgi:putative transposase